jgi:hypothetical protein
LVNLLLIYSRSDLDPLARGGNDLAPLTSGRRGEIHFNFVSRETSMNRILLATGILLCSVGFAQANTPAAGQKFDYILEDGQPGILHRSPTCKAIKHHCITVHWTAKQAADHGHACSPCPKSH